VPEPTTSLEIVLGYAGPDVDDGTMALDDLIPALQGFAGAYGKIAASKGYTTHHKLRLVGIRRGSANIILDIWDGASKNSQQLQAIGSVVAAAMSVLTVLFQVINVKKHTEKRPYREDVSAGLGDINIINSKNVSLSISVDAYNVLKNELIDSDLAKIVAPLQSGQVDESELSVNADGVRLGVTVTATDKQYFETAKEPATSTGEMWLIGTINSMTKSTNSGYIYLADGTRVYYKIKGEKPDRFYWLFSHGGPVKVRCVANLDDSLKPTSLDVFEMVAMQEPLFTPEARV
jgi:hypothetical protein